MENSCKKSKCSSKGNIGYGAVQFFELTRVCICVNDLHTFFQTLFFSQVRNVAVSKFSFRSTNTFKLNCQLYGVRFSMNETCNYIRSFVFCALSIRLEIRAHGRLEAVFRCCRQTMPMRRKFLNVMWIFVHLFVCLFALVLTNDCVIVLLLLLIIFISFVFEWCV